MIAVARMPAPVPGDSGEVQTVAWHAARELRETLFEAVAELPRETRAEAIFLRGYPAPELVEAAEKGIDLLLLGTRGGGPLRRALYGSVSSNVLRMAPCPVLITPASADRVLARADTATAEVVPPSAAEPGAVPA